MRVPGTVLLTALPALFFAGAASAAEVKVFSAGAMELGLRGVVTDYEKRSGDSVVLSFAAPKVLKARASSPVNRRMC
ncbi:MAG: hypothetical protein ACREVL_02165 [Solimonas sp.]